MAGAIVYHFFGGFKLAFVAEIASYSILITEAGMNAAASIVRDEPVDMPTTAPLRSTIGVPFMMLPGSILVSITWGATPSSLLGTSATISPDAMRCTTLPNKPTTDCPSAG